MLHLEAIEPWLEPPGEEGGVRLAGVKDIAAMKVNSITNRGTRKDFVDMARLLDDYSLEDIFSWYREKYPAANLVLLRKQRLLGRAVEKHCLRRLDLERRRALRHPRGVLAVVRPAFLLPSSARRWFRRLLLPLAVIVPARLVKVEEAKPRFPDQRLHLAP